jgi:hypothetical protein
MEKLSFGGSIQGPQFNALNPRGPISWIGTRPTVSGSESCPEVPGSLALLTNTWSRSRDCGSRSEPGATHRAQGIGSTVTPSGKVTVLGA